MTGSYDHTAKIWSAKGATETLPLGEQKKIIPGSAFSPRGDRIVTVSLDGTAMVRHAETGEPLLALNHGDVVWCVAYSPDPEGARIVTGTQNGSIVVWNAVTGGELLRIDRGHAREIHTIQFSKDGKRILSAGKDGTSRLWDALDGREIRRFELNQPFVFAAFSPDSRRIVMVCSDNIRTTREKADAVVRDAETGQTILSLNGHGNGFSAVAYSPDGRFIVTGSIDWTASVWDASTGKEKLSLKGHHDQVISLAVSPDSRRIFTGGFDLTTRVWDATHGEEMLTLKGGLIEPPGLSSDGRRFVTGPGPPATVWSAASTDQIERWQTEERLAAKRLAAQRRESAAPIESNDALNDF